EKAELQRQLIAVKEEKALLERASTLKDKDEAAEVDRLIAKWQIACSSASEDLFDQLKPMMEAQRQAAEIGFGNTGFDYQNANDSNVCRADNDSRLTDNASDIIDAGSDDDGSGNKSVAAAMDPSSEDIDIPYMLKCLGIDPDLF
ncbi:hypothetical protein LPJ64_006327, partial [Coemansia asiatica]